MDDRDFQRLMDLVGDALEVPVADREVWLRERCSGTLLEEALSLLEGAPDLDRVTHLLEDRVARQAVDFSRTTDQEFPNIRGYRVLERIGAGGMGVVYRAQDESLPEREVAIKLVRDGIASDEVLLRFEAERQVLARLEHPNIAAIHAAGSDDRGRPYFVMELVEGAPLVEYCDRNEIPMGQRLDLFATVCDAVQHAHHRGVIHRDLRPSNVLITQVGGRPFPKIIDFGIAKLTDVYSKRTSALTSAGMLVGTLEYMSPEQARAAPGEVDARSDIYALGVLLYELCCGVLPFEAAQLREVGISVALQRIQDQIPKKPSERVQTQDPDSVTAASQRGTTPRNLARELRGDLDWIVGRALAKRPSDRYQSARDLADDVRRHLDNEPVVAGPPSRIYRLRRFARRHRTVALATASIAVALVLGGVLAGIGFFRASASRRVAEKEAQKVEVINDFLTNMLASVQPDKARGREVTVREVLDEALATLDADSTLRSAPMVEASLLFTIGDTYQALGDYPTALHQLTRARQIYEDEKQTDGEDYFDTLDRIGMVQWLSGDLQASLDISKALLEIRRRQYGENHPEYASVLANLANTYADMGQLDRAEELMRKVVAIDRRASPDAPSTGLCYSLNNLASILADEKKFEEAVDLHRESLAMRSRVMGPDSPAVAISLMNLGFALRGMGSLGAAKDTLQSAVAKCEAVFGANHYRTAAALSNLAGVEKDLGKLPDAERDARESLARMTNSVGTDSWRQGRIRAFLSEVLLEEDQVDEARKEATAAWKLLSTDLGEDDARTQGVARTLARIAQRRNDAEAAAKWWAKAGRGDD
jgi:serine/threonine protein kinase/tetratricopeptide (TPR) repeat protein